MLPSLSTAIFTMSGVNSRLAIVAVGKSILIVCSRIMLRLASMNEASRKNMISINGMISMRALRWGSGEPIFIAPSTVHHSRPRHGRSRSRWHVLPAKLDGVKSLLFCGGHHHFHVGRGGFQFELKLGQFAGEIIERNQRDNGDGQTAHGGDERLADATRNLTGGAFHRRAADRQKRAENPGDGAQKTKQRRQCDQ